MQQLKEEILAGRLVAGERLPGERQLSEALGVSRASVREALRVLEALEVIVVQRGAGTGAGLVVNAEPGKALSTLLSFEVALGHFTMTDVVELRALLERSSARCATAAMTDEHRQHLQDIVDSMNDSNLSREEFHARDTEFHVGLAEAGGNTLVAHLMHALREAIQRQMLQAFRRSDWPTLAAQLHDEHQAILDAVASGDADTAARIMDAHVAEFYAKALRDETVSERDRR
ncbi:FadR/GntR family transcriptional regulator [Micromonospora sp. NPDC005161]